MATHDHGRRDLLDSALASQVRLAMKQELVRRWISVKGRQCGKCGNPPDSDKRFLFSFLTFTALCQGCYSQVHPKSTKREGAHQARPLVSVSYEDRRDSYKEEGEAPNREEEAQPDPFPPDPTLRCACGAGPYSLFPGEMEIKECVACRPKAATAPISAPQDVPTLALRVPWLDEEAGDDDGEPDPDAEPV